MRTSAACMGQGGGTVTVHIVCDITGVGPENIVHERPNTATTPNSGTSTAARRVASPVNRVCLDAVDVPEFGVVAVFGLS